MEMMMVNARDKYISPPGEIGLEFFAAARANSSFEQLRAKLLSKTITEADYGSNSWPVLSFGISADDFYFIIARDSGYDTRLGKSLLTSFESSYEFNIEFVFTDENGNVVKANDRFYP